MGSRKSSHDFNLAEYSYRHQSNEYKAPVNASDFQARQGREQMSDVRYAISRQLKSSGNLNPRPNQSIDLNSRTSNRDSAELRAFMEDRRRRKMQEEKAAQTRKLAEEERRLMSLEKVDQDRLRIIEADYRKRLERERYNGPAFEVVLPPDMSLKFYDKRTNTITEVHGKDAWSIGKKYYRRR